MPKKVLFTFTSSEVTWYQMQLCLMRKTTVVSIFKHFFHLITHLVTWLKPRSPRYFFFLNLGLNFAVFGDFSWKQHRKYIHIYTSALPLSQMFPYTGAYLPFPLRHQQLISASRLSLHITISPLLSVSRKHAHTHTNTRSPIITSSILYCCVISLSHIACPSHRVYPTERLRVRKYVHACCMSKCERIRGE